MGAARSRLDKFSTRIREAEALRGSTLRSGGRGVLEGLVSADPTEIGDQSAA